MKTMLALLGLIFSGVAAAATGSFYAIPGTTTCPSYCAPFSNDNPDVQVGYVNVTYTLSTGRVTLSVNGVTYVANGVYTEPLGTFSGKNYYNVTNAVAVAGDGSTVTVSLSFENWKTKIVSGRDAGRYTQHYYVDSGTVVR